MSKKKKAQKIGKLNPNLIKTRDIVHMQEFLANKGGAHSDKRRKNKHSRRDQEAQEGED